MRLRQPSLAHQLDIPERIRQRLRVSRWATRSGTVVAALLLLVFGVVAGLGALRLARGEAHSGVTLLAGALGLVLGVWMLRLTPERRAGAAVALVAAGLGLLGTEAFLAWRTLSAPPPHGPGFDSRSVLEVVRDLRAQGTPAVPALLSSYARASGSELVPLGGLADADTVFCNESGAYVVYRSDSDGFNNPPDAAGDVDFVVLGDSFAHGQCVPQGMDVAGRIGGGVELIHFGRGLRATGVVACCCPAGSGAAV